MDHNHLIDKIAFWNAFLTAVALYPQVVDSIISKSTEGLSVLSFAIIGVNSAVWMVYGAHRNLPPLVISSVLNLVAAILIVRMALI